MRPLQIILITIYLVGAFNVHAQKSISKLNSNEGSLATIYLDFDGELVRATSWNWDGPIVAEKPDLTTDMIRQIFERVAADFRIFDVNITTDSIKYFHANPMRRMRLIVTPTYEWYGRAGGVALVGSFNWGDDTPCWVFSNLLSNDAKYIAEAISHELGHTLGLLHQSKFDEDCNKVMEYADGVGSGKESWAPIMGLSYYKNISTWTIGPSELSCNIIQDDISQISEHLSLRLDDYADEVVLSTPLPLNGINIIGSGMITSTTDKDIFSVTLNKTTRFQLNVKPESLFDTDEGANLNVRLSLLNETMDTIYVSDDTSTLCARFDSTLENGKYFIVVQGTGNENMSSYESRGMYSLVGMVANALPVNRIDVWGRYNGNRHIINWKVSADEKINEIDIQQSENGYAFHEIGRFHASQGEISRAIENHSRQYYRVRVLTASGSQYLSKIISIQDKGKGKPVLQSTTVNNSIRLTMPETGSYVLIGSGGEQIQAGQVLKGSNTINMNKPYRGILFLRILTGLNNYNFTLIKP